MVTQHAVLPGGPPGGLLAGQVVGSRFTCLGLLSQDHLGPLYRAQRADGTPCTLQLLVLRPDSRATARRELSQGLRAAAALRHPSLGGPVEVFTDDSGATYLIREALAGETLAARLSRLGRPPVDAAFDILERVAGALRVAHRKGLFHLHLSPEKIFLQKSPHGAIVRLLDLGLARIVRPEQHVGGLLIPRYVSPEQVVSPRSIDARTDIYGLGLLLYELLSGRPPFSSADSDVLQAQHVNDNAPTLADRAPDRLFSAELEGLLGSMLAKAPQDRPKDAAALLSRLQKLRQEGDLVIALDDREVGLLSEWSVASVSEGDAIELQDEEPEADESADLPGPKDRPRPPPPRRASARLPVGPPGKLQEVDRRSAPRTALTPGLDSILRTDPGTGLLDLGRAPSSPPAPAPALVELDVTVNDLGESPASLGSLWPAASPASPDDALESLLLPSRSGEEAAQGRAEKARAWLRQPEMILRRPVPRFALVFASLGCVLGIVALLWLLGDPEPPAMPVQQARLRTAKPAPGAVHAARPAPAAQVQAQGRPMSPPPLPAAAPVARAPTPLAEPLKVAAPPPGLAPPPRISVTAALGEPLRLPAPDRDRAAPVHHRRREGRLPEEDEPPRARSTAANTATPSSVTIRILSSPTGAQVLRDGQVLGTTPFSEARRRASQTLTYELHRAGYEIARVEVAPSEDRMMQLDLSPIMALK